MDVYTMKSTHRADPFCRT